MKKNLLLAFILSSFSGSAQSLESHPIEAVIHTFFIGMRTTDSVLVRQTVGLSCSLKSIIETKAGETKLVEENFEDFLKTIGTPHEGVVYDERILSYDIKIDGDMALAWTPYRFYLNEKFSHCGVNVFTLMRTAEGWKIIGIIDTRRKEDCDF